jgi:hypothetical protein
LRCEFILLTFIEGILRAITTSRQNRTAHYRSLHYQVPLRAD